MRDCWFAAGYASRFSPAPVEGLLGAGDAPYLARHRRGGSGYLAHGVGAGRLLQKFF